MGGGGKRGTDRILVQCTSRYSFRPRNFGITQGSPEKKNPIICVCVYLCLPMERDRERKKRIYFKELALVGIVMSEI